MCFRNLRLLGGCAGLRKFGRGGGSGRGCQQQGREGQQRPGTETPLPHLSAPPTAMELAHSLLLNEEALGRISESKRNVFVFEWLRFLDKVLVAAQKV